MDFHRNIEQLPYWDRVRIALRQVVHAWPAFENWVEEHNERNDQVHPLVKDVIHVTEIWFKAGQQMDEAVLHQLSSLAWAQLDQAGGDPFGSAFVRTLGRLPLCLSNKGNVAAVIEALDSYLDAARARGACAFAERGIADDIETIHRASTHPKWGERSPHSLAVFAEFSEFDHAPSILTDELAARLCRNPGELESMEWRDFEILIADLINDMGLKVRLTQKTRDGGFDILALEDSLRQTRILVECKRQRDRVSVGVVRRLHGTIHDQGADFGLVVTTAGFTRDAKVYLEKHKLSLGGRDLPAIIEWLEDYQRGIQKNRLLL